MSKIGEILVQCGMITSSELEEALDLAQRERVRLGEALVKMGVLGEEQLVWALGIQFDLSQTELSEDLVDWDLLMRLPIEQLHGLMVLPLTPADGMNRVVIADPTVDGLKEFIEELYPGRQVLVQLASPHEMDDLFEQVGRRRHRVRHPGKGPWTPPPANALMRWIPRLESARIERVVVFPTAREEYAATTFPWTGEGAEHLSAGEMKSILDRLFVYFSCDSPSSYVTCGLRSAARIDGGRGIRAIAVDGAGGHLMALEGISPSPPRKSRRRVTLLSGKDPIALKAALLAEATARSQTEGAAPALILSLESHIDFLADSVFQAELADATVRFTVSRSLIGAARPDVMLLEIDSEDELSRLPIEASMALAGRFFVIVRGFPRKTALPIPLEGIDRVEMPSEAQALREQIRALLRGPAAD